MSTSSSFRYAGGALLCTLSLISSVTSLALPAATYNRARDTSCPPQYGRIQVLGPGAGPASVYLDTTLSDNEQYSYYSTVNSDVSAGIFKYQNCNNHPVADLECINYAGPDSTFNKFGLLGAINSSYWQAVAVPHIGGSAPPYLPSYETIPAFIGLTSDQSAGYVSESAVWSMNSDGTLEARYTQSNGSYIPSLPIRDQNGGIVFLSSILVNDTMQVNFQFVPIKLEFGQVCYESSWSDKLPCRVGTCKQPSFFLASSQRNWICS